MKTGSEVVLVEGPLAQSASKLTNAFIRRLARGVAIEVSVVWDSLFGFQFLGFGLRVSVCGFRVRVSGSEFRVRVLGCRVQVPVGPGWEGNVKNPGSGGNVGPIWIQNQPSGRRVPRKALRI